MNKAVADRPESLRDFWAKIRLPLRSRLVGEGAWVAFGQVASALGALVGTRLLTEYMEAELFGAVSLLLGMIALGANLTCFPLTQAMVRLYPDAALQGNTRALRAAVGRSMIGTTAAFAVFLLFGGLAVRGASLENLATFGLLVGVFIMDVLRSVGTEMLMATRRRRLPALWLAADGWARPLVAVALVVALGKSAGAVLLGYLASSGLVFLGFLVALRREQHGSAPVDREYERQLSREAWHYALPLIPLGLVSSVNALSDRYVVGGLLGLGEAGIYTAAFGLVSRPYLMAYSIIETTLRPVYYNAVASGDKKRERRIAIAWLATTLLTCGTGTLLFALFSRLVVGLLLSRNFSAAADLCPWIALGHFFLMISYTFYRSLYAHKLTRSVFSLRCLAAFLTVSLGFLMTYCWGLIGTAVAVPIAFGVEVVILVAYCWMRSLL